MNKSESRMLEHAAGNRADAGKALPNYSAFFCSVSNNRRYKIGAGTAGILKGDVFVKDVYESKHLLRSPRGWAFDKVQLEQARRDGATRIDVRDKETGKVYRCSIDEFFRLSIKIDRGHGVQFVLPLEYWKVVLPGEQAEQSSFWPAGGAR